MWRMRTLAMAVALVCVSWGSASADETCLDADLDGFDTCDPGDPGDLDGRLADCDDESPGVWPGAQEWCDGVDNDCDGLADEDYDQDGDGFPWCGALADCDDTDPSIYPGAEEVCNGLDDDCDWQADEGFDQDGDGFTSCGGDCDDTNPAARPGNEEYCNDFDDNCDGTIDEGCWVACTASLEGQVFYDADEDGQADPGEPLLAGAEIQLEGPDCDGDGTPEVRVGLADESGQFAFDDLCLGTWNVEYVSLPYDIATTPFALDVALDVCDDVQTVGFGLRRTYVTRTLGYWKNHSCAIAPLLPIAVGDKVFTTAEEARTFLAKPPKGNKKVLLAKRILLAKLNTAAFGLAPIPLGDVDGDGAAETVADLVARAEWILAHGNKWQRKLWLGITAWFNGAGAFVPLPDWYATCPSDKKSNPWSWGWGWGW